jgi:pimeloyl-ACP methyl ester carboxylesterase
MSSRSIEPAAETSPSAWRGFPLPIRLGFHVGPLPGEPADATFATVAGTRVHYVDQGIGPAVVLLHGFGSSLEIWDQVIPEIAREHRVVALDLKGFGWSDRPEGDYSPLAQAKLVWALLDHLGIEQAALVGHSWGASVTLAMALGAPKRTTRIAVYDGWAYEEQLSWLFRWARFDGIGESLISFYDPRLLRHQMATAFYDPAHLTQRRIKRAQSSMALPGSAGAALATMRGMRFAEQQARYTTLRVPALVLWGQQDNISAPSFGHRLSADLSAQLIMYPRCGHFPMIEAKQVSNPALADFLREDVTHPRVRRASFFRRLVRAISERGARASRP